MESTRPHKSVKDLVENLLFLSNEPLSLNRLAESLPHSKEEIAAALDSLQVEYLDRGLKIRYTSGGYEITTDPALVDEIETFFNLQRKKRLSRQALETLTVIAYNQPVTRAGVECIRGVQTSGTIHTLTDYGLIRVVGQKDTLGNPYLYGTTDEFLRHFGLADVSDLPPLEFGQEGLTRPPSDTDAGVVKQGGSNGEVEGEITQIDFEPAEDTQVTSTDAQQKGA